MPTRRASRAFFARPADVVARRLLGCRLVRLSDDGVRLSGVIVETEAYLGPEDAAAHSFGGRRTTRTEPMYMRPGTSYVYFTYGMHFCMNISTAREGVPHAVLLRALEPIEGLEQMARRRSRSGKQVSTKELCSGPAKLCQALAIDRGLNAVDLVTSPSLWVEYDRQLSDSQVENTPRIGIDYAGPWVEKPLRWVVVGSSYASRRPRARKLSR